jgi:nuclear pore complex protein Nup93
MFRYKVFMQSVVASNLHVARPGGVPGTFPLVRSFTAVQESSNILGTEDGLVDSQPVWALIYFCLRCGDNKAALYCAQQAGSVF